MSKTVDGLYGVLPVWAQNVAVSAYGLYWRSQRFGGRFERYLLEFQERETMTPEEMGHYVFSELRGLLETAFLNVPYYRSVWADAGFSAADIGRGSLTEVLERIPITRKDDVRRDPWSFVAEDLIGKRGLREYLTSGSTGTPVTAIIRADDRRRFMAARETRSFNWANTSILKPRSMIGGRMVVPRAQIGPPFHRFNSVENQVYLSAFHISPETVADYVKALDRHRPAVMTGYAHSHFTLGRFMLEKGLALSYRPDALVLSSEKITPEMRKTIEQAFSAPVFEEYGCVENCVLATECKEGSLHVSPDFGIVEILDDLGRPVPPGVDGRIVCTGLLNRTQFLVRYEVGDRGCWAAEPCPCGRGHLPVIEEIVGRLEDVVVGPDGREMVRFHGIFVGLDGLKEAQIIQESMDCIRVNVVAEESFGRVEERIIAERFLERLGPVRVEVVRVPRVERNARGKFRSVISKVRRSDLSSVNRGGGNVN